MIHEACSLHFVHWPNLLHRPHFWAMTLTKSPSSGMTVQTRGLNIKAKKMHSPLSGDTWPGRLKAH